MLRARSGLALAAALCLCHATAYSRTDPESETEYAIVVTGTPLLNGTYADQHTQFLTRALHALGARCVVSITLGDDRKDLLDGLAYAAQRASLILVTGGLGPTLDDITREVLSEYTGIKLQQQPELLERLKQRFARSGGDLPPVQQRMALVPAKGSYLPNPNGTAVGLVFDSGERLIVALPGPPRELQPMVKNELVPFLVKRLGLRASGASMTLRFAGVGQSRIDQVMRENGKALDGVSASSTISGAGRVDFSAAMKTHREEDWTRLKELKEQLISQLGEFIYSEDGSTLEQTVLRRLDAGQKSLCLVEIASSGAVAASLNRAGAKPGSLLAGFVAPTARDMGPLLGLSQASLDQADKSGEAVVRILAQEARRRTGSDWVLAVGETRSGEDGSPFVWVVAGSDGSGYSGKRLPLTAQRDTVQDAIVTQTLHFLGRTLSK